MDRRSFVQLAALGGAALALPGGLTACNGAASLTGEPGAGGTFSGQAARVRRFGSDSGHTFDVYGLDSRIDFFGPGGDLVGRVTSGLNVPVALAVDDRGRVLVLELGGARVRVFDLAARPLGLFAEGLALSYPGDLAIAPGSGVVAIADTLAHRVVLLDGEGGSPREVGSLGARAGQFNGPTSVAFSPDGARLYVADVGNARVQVFSAAGQTLGTLGGGGFVRPHCVRVDAAGYVYVADDLGGAVSIFDPGHARVRSLRPAVRGTHGTPLWLSSQSDGSVLLGAVAGAPA